MPAHPAAAGLSFPRALRSGGMARNAVWSIPKTGSKCYHSYMDTRQVTSSQFGEQECDMLFDIDLMGRITTVHFCNHDLAHMLGYEENELIGENVTDFLVDAKSVAGAEHFGVLYASEEAFRATSRRLALKNGQSVIAESYLMPTYDSQGKLIGHRGMEFFTLDHTAQEK